jgi:hypothetical protein
VQHALRAFTANDRKAIKAASENYPSTEFYQVDELITQLGMGEALVTGLNEKGIPTELVHTMLRPPFSRMDVLTDYEIGSILKKSSLIKEYNVEIDRESAYEILQEKMREKELERQEEEEYSRARAEYRPSRKDTESRTEPSTFEQILKSPVTHTIAREVARGIFGVLLGGSTKSPRRRR